MRRFAGNRSLTPGANMHVTRLQLRLANEDGIRAYVDITLDHCLLIHGLALIRHSTDYLVAISWGKRRGGNPTKSLSRLRRTCEE
jgi:hypothetical protein